MRPSVAVVADDLTGAADTGVGFLRAGLATTVVWADPVLDADAVDDADVLAIDTRSRAATDHAAERTTAQVVATLRAAGVPLLYVKIDSTLRGHVGRTVAAALTHWDPAAVAVVAPAFPATGRTTVGGRQRVGDMPLDVDPLPTLLRHAGIAAAHVDLATVRGAALSDVLAARRAAGARAIVCDAETDDDLRAVARAGTGLDAPVVWVGSGGLAGALSIPSGSPSSGSVARQPEPPLVPTGGPVLVTVGSVSDIARAQARDVVGAGAVPVVVPVSAVDGTAAPATFVTKVAAHLRSGEDVVLTLGTEVGVGGPDDHRLSRRLGMLLRPVAPLVGGLVLTGGDTATGILRAWETTALRLCGEVEPGVPLSVSVAPRPLPVVTKAGAFGSTSTLTAARAALTTLLTSRGGR